MKRLALASFGALVLALAPMSAISMTTADAPTVEGAVGGDPVDEGPAVEGPADEGPIEEGPVQEGPVQEGPADKDDGEGPVQEGSADDGSDDEGPVDEGPVEEGAQGPAADAGDVLQEVTPPELLEFVQAVLPPELDIPDGQYVVVLTLTIDENGAVTEVSAADPPRPELVAPAIEAARKFRFKPATYQDKPVLVQVQYEYQFEVRQKIREVVRVFLTLERGTRDPISEVSGFIEETGATFTSIDGRMEISNLQPGKYTLYIPAGEFDEIRQEFKVGADDRAKPPESPIYLKRAYGAVSNQTIIRAPREARFAAKQSLSAGELVSFPGSAGDVLKVVENLPGIARSSFGVGQLVVYGSPPNDTKVFINQMPFVLLYHFAGLYSVINSDFIEAIDFVPAGFDASYGGAVGGIVNVKLKDEPLKAWHGSIDVNLLHAGIIVGGPYKKDSGDIQIAFRRSYYDAILKSINAFGDGRILTSAPAYYDYQVRLQHRFSGGHKLTFFINGSDDRGELINEENDVNPTFVGSVSGALWGHALQATWNWEPRAGLSNELKVQGLITQAGFDVFGQVKMKVRDHPVTIKETLTVQAHSKVVVRAGLNFDVDPYSFLLKGPQMGLDGENMTPYESSEVLELSGDGVMATISPWISVEYKPVERLTLVPSIRADLNVGTWKAWSIDPRLSMTVDAIKDKLSFRAAGGLYSQPPQSFTLIEGYGNPDIDPENGTHALVGFQYNPIDRLTLDFNGFFKYFWNRAQVSDDATVRYDNGGIGRAWGFDVLLRMNPSERIPLTGWIAYTFVKSELYDFGLARWRPSDFQQNHNLNIAISYKLPRNWTIGGRFRLTSGYPYTKYESYQYDADNDTYVGVRAPGINAQELPLFHQLDIRVDKEWVFKAWRLGLYLEVQNVYFHKNPEGVIYNYDYSKMAYLTGLPILPVLGIKGSF